MLWGILVSIFWFMILFAWIGLLVMIFGDLFRDQQLSGWATALWGLVLLVMRWLGARIDMVARGRLMNERARQQEARDERELRRHVQRAAGPPRAAEHRQLPGRPRCIGWLRCG